MRELTLVLLLRGYKNAEHSNSNNLLNIRVFHMEYNTTSAILRITANSDGTSALQWLSNGTTSSAENIAAFNSSGQLKFPNGSLMWIA